MFAHCDPNGADRPSLQVGAAERGAADRPARILVVEDERHIARLLEFVLSRAGYEVCICHSGEHALLKLEKFKPDALVLDFLLPGMTGADFLRAVRAMPIFGNCAVVILSSQWLDRTETTLIGADVTAMCSKPIAPTSLLRKLNELGVRVSMPLGDR